MAISDVSQEGIKHTTTGLADGTSITWSATANAHIGGQTGGKAVTLTGADYTYERCADAERVDGKLLLVDNDDDVITVATEGVVALIAGVGGCSRGSKIVGAVDGSGNEGYVRDNAGGAEDAVAAHRCLNTAAAGETVYVDLEG